MSVPAEFKSVCALSGKVLTAGLIVIGCLVLAGCGDPPAEKVPPLDAAFLRLTSQEVAELPLAPWFSSPMGGEQGALTYNAQRFRTNRHLGDDLNGIGGWNSDLGDAVYASGTGRVLYAGTPSAGWGKVVILGHRVPDQTAAAKWVVYQTLYAHLDTMTVNVGELVPRGTVLGTVGTADGRYYAHLHFEVRKNLSVYPGVGYSAIQLDRVSPEAFLNAHKGPLIINPEVGPSLEKQ